MVYGCMVYTELAPRRQQFHVAPAMPALKYTTSVDSKNNNTNFGNQTDTNPKSAVGRLQLNKHALCYMWLA